MLPSKARFSVAGNVFEAITVNKQDLLSAMMHFKAFIVDHNVFKERYTVKHNGFIAKFTVSLNAF